MMGIMGNKMDLTQEFRIRDVGILELNFRTNLVVVLSPT